MKERKPSYRPPIVSFAFAVCFGAAGAGALDLGRWFRSETIEWIRLALFVLAIKFLVRSFHDLAKLSHERHRSRTMKDLTRRHGSARLADADDIESAGLFAKEGIFLGSFGEGRKTRDIRYDQDCSVNIVSPPGGSKSLAIAVNTLITDLGHSRIVNDVSGELYCLTHEHLRKHQNVHVITPWPEELSKRLGTKIEDSGWNLFYDFEPDQPSHTVRSYIQSKVQIVLPREQREKTDKNSLFFELRGRDLIEFLCFYLIWKECSPTLPAMRSLLMEGYQSLQSRLNEATSSDAFGGTLQEAANSLYSTMVSASDQFGGYLGVAENALSIYDVGSNFNAHCGKSFDPRTLKDDDRRTTVFVIYPVERARTHQPALNATFSTLIEAVIADSRPKRVTAILDEVAACGRLDLTSWLNTGRKSGLRILALWQDLLGGQAEAVYGKSEMKQIIAAAEITAAFNVTSQETLELLSKMTGTVALESASLTDRSRWNDPLSETTLSRSHQNRPLMHPDEIRRMASDEMLIFKGNSPVIKAKKVPFYERPAFKRLCGDNPYFAG
ncbi:MAG: type IV secretory system conjugative DNA transfer family protein [Fuerstiella sp.]